MSGRHRTPRRLRGNAAVAAGAALVVVLVAGGWFGVRALTAPPCRGQLRITVAAPAELVPALQAAAADWSAGGAEVDGVCASADVSAAETVDIAAAVATGHGVSLTGVGQASGATGVPDVWVPDSSTWVLRLRTAAAGFAPTASASVARSPVVLAMPEPVAGTLGWPNAKPGWGALLAQLSGTRLRAGIVEPTRDATGLAGLLALGQAAGAAGADSPRATTAALRALAAGRSQLRQDLLARFPRSPDPAAIATGLGAAAVSEQAVIAFNAARPPIPLAALYLQPAPLALDYPYTVMPGIDPARARAADGLRAALGGPAFRDRLGAAGLRGPDGVAGAGFAAPLGAPGPGGLPSPAAAALNLGGGPAVAAIDRALSTWVAVTLPARMLAVIDVSGSMLEPVPTAGGATRARVTAEAATRGLALFDDSWAVGLWTFSTRLVGDRDYREVVPIGPLSSQRVRLLAGLGELAPKPGGGTGLYDTVLAAYRTVQAGWEAGKINSVVLLTDGENDDGVGLSLDGLLAELRKIKDPRRPIQVVVVGIGPSVGADALTRITRTTGGGVFTTEDPARIGDIFLRAVSLRTQGALPG